MSRSTSHKRTAAKVYSIAILTIIIIGTAIAKLFFENGFQMTTPVTAAELPQSELTTINLNQVEDTKYLQLVNATYGIDQECSQVMLETSVNGIGLRSEALYAVAGLLNATRSEIGGDLVLNSGFRNASVQAALYDGADDKSFVQRPNHSEHQTGLAMDIAILNVKNVENSAQSKYLRKNSWRYGLVLRYAADKTQITKISNEPWHFRYVGDVHAKCMYDQNMCLEEYINMLKKTGGYAMTITGKHYTVSYQKADNGALIVPKNGNYGVSSDNTGGYIVTSWK
jgi:D-alanyl-D-alanine carboxypeptidase